MIDLMRTHTVPLYKRESDGGYLNHNHEWVESPFLPATELECNIQPLRENNGKNKNILPDGIRTDEVKCLRTFTKLLVADHINDQEGDEVEYEGFRYEVFIEEDYSQYGLPTDHYKYIIRRKDER